MGGLAPHFFSYFDEEDFVRREYIENAGQYLKARQIQGEIGFMLFYRTLIIKLLIVFFLVTLCSLSLLLFSHELVIYLTASNVAYLSPLFYGVAFFTTAGCLYGFLREDVFLKQSVRKVYGLKKIAPSM